MRFIISEAIYHFIYLKEDVKNKGHNDDGAVRKIVKDEFLESFFVI